MRLKRDNSGAEQGTIVDVLDTSGQVIDTSEPPATHRRNRPHHRCTAGARQRSDAVIISCHDGADIGRSSGSDTGYYAALLLTA